MMMCAVSNLLTAETFNGKQKKSRKQTRFFIIAFWGVSLASAFPTFPLVNQRPRVSFSKASDRRGRAATNSLSLSLFSSTLLDSSRSVEGDEGAFASSFLYEGTFQGLDDGLLDYLPNRGMDLPPKTKRLLRRATSEYVYGVANRPQLKLRDVMSVIEEEYSPMFSPVPLTLVNETLSQNGRKEEQLFVDVLSFAILHRLPKEITLRLFGSRDAMSGNDKLSELIETFDKVGWEQVSFPKGVGLCVRSPNLTYQRPVVSPYSSSFFPPSRIPWRTASSRKAATAAQRGIINAAEAKPPPQNIMSKEEFLVEIENEIAATSFPVAKPDDSLVRRLSLEDTPLPSFPPQGFRAWTSLKRAMMESSDVLSRNKSWKKFSTAMDTQYTKLKKAGRAGFMAYAFINFVLYTVGIAWQWRRMAVEMPTPSASLLSITMQKFGKAFARVYVGASLFKLARIGVALALAPAAGRVLQFTQRKLGVSENAAFIIWITLLLKTFFATLAAVILGDSALRKTISSPRVTEAIIQEAASAVGRSTVIIV